MSGTGPHQQVGYPHHYNIPVTMGGANIPPGHGQPPSNIAYGMRPGSVATLQQQNASKALDRPPTAHLIPQHLSSPHLGDRASAESPHLVPVYAQRQMNANYSSPGHSGPQQHHSPSIPSAHQQQLRQTFTHPFEFEENGRTYAQSPGYVQGLDREREAILGRDGSPFNINMGSIRRGIITPPPAHLIPRYGHLPTADAPLSSERQRHQTHTPPHASPVPPQGDSLLNLLQVRLIFLAEFSGLCRFLPDLF